MSSAHEVVAVADTISSALCGVMEQALVEKGINPELARTLAKKACEPAVTAAPAVAAKTARKATKAARSARSKMSKALQEANRRLRTKSGKLRKGKTQADVMKLAQRPRRKM